MPHIPSHRFGTSNPIDPGFKRPPPGGLIPPFRPGDPGFNPGQGDLIGPFPGLPGSGGQSGGTFPDLEGDFIKELFGEEPRLAFFGALNNQRQNFSPIQREFFPTQFNQFQNRFFGQLGNQIQGGTPLGELPTFQDFLGGIDFQKEFRSLPPGLRPGSSQARFRPPTQFRF